MIDWTRVNELREEVGAEDFDEVVELFLSEVEDRLSTLSANKPLPQIEEDMHFLKGSALNLGFTGFAALCQTAETAAGSGVAWGDTERVFASYQASKAQFINDLGQMDAA